MGKSIEQFLSHRSEMVGSTFSRQTSVPTPGAITLSGGTPDFDTPPHIIEAAIKALKDGATKYTAWPGITSLREALADKLLCDQKVKVDPGSELLVTLGAQGAIMGTIMATINPGDEVIIPTPFFDEYRRDIMLAGGVMVPVPTREANDFQVQPADIEKAVTEKTKMIILVTPCNPTGAVAQPAELEGIAEIARKHDLLVVSDEIYEKYIYDGNKHTSIASLPGMWERSIIIHSFSKTYGMTGFRVGFIAARPEIIKGILPINHGMTICAPAAFQWASQAALTGPMDWFEVILKEYDKRRRMWMSALDEMGLTYGRPKGAYYVMFNVTSTGLSSRDFAQAMRNDAKVIIGSGGGPTDQSNEGYNRGSFAVPTKQLEEGLARMIPVVRKMKGM